MLIIYTPALAAPSQIGKIDVGFGRVPSRMLGTAGR